jgi:hypothetical protein
MRERRTGGHRTAARATQAPRPRNPARLAPSARTSAALNAVAVRLGCSSFFRTTRPARAPAGFFARRKAACTLISICRLRDLRSLGRRRKRGLSWKVGHYDRRPNLYDIPTPDSYLAPRLFIGAGTLPDCSRPRVVSRFPVLRLHSHLGLGSSEYARCHVARQGDCDRYAETYV